MCWRLLLISLTMFFIGCGGKQNSGKSKSVENPRGKQLSEIYCSSCHLYADVELLDRSSWDKVLSTMEKEMEKVSMHIEKEDWLDIQRYYLANSPLILPQAAAKNKIRPGNLFQKEDLIDAVPGAIPVVTMIKYDRERNVLYTGDVSGNIFAFNHIEYADKINVDNIPIDVEFIPEENSLEVLGMGSLMPSNARTGQLIRIDSDGNKRVVIDSLERPVHFIREDLDGDGKVEHVISCFGSTVGPINSGKLTMFTLDAGLYQEKVIKELPGAIKSITGDFNSDGRLDIIALFAQGKEVISMFLNKGNLEFEENPLLEFIPVYGSNDFELADINYDSYPDIILTNGDNGDNTPIFKYYHGVRIFINDGNYAFTEKYFYPVNGASQVLVRDFDTDGDFDMIVLAMYPDLFSWGEEALVYFENLAGFNFEPTYLEKEPSGKWLLMDAGDIDDDGDEDLIVGTNIKIRSVLLPAKFKTKWSNSKTSYTVFTNNLISY